jgi:SAM-dependent methyltransferase
MRPKSGDYSTVTETPGDQITREAASMLVTRYAQAAQYCAGKDVLEVGCGSGHGLGYLGACARRLVAGDYTHRLLTIAGERYGGRFPLVRLDAEGLPFGASCFDVVVLHEAIYYLQAPERFVSEARRVLRPGGRLIISTINREWQDFNPSPFSHAYPTAAGLRTMLEEQFSAVDIYASFPASPASPALAARSVLKRCAVRSGLMPKTMSGKRLLKRLFFGGLVAVPAEITDEFAPHAQPVRVAATGPCTDYKLLCAVARA